MNTLCCELALLQSSRTWAMDGMNISKHKVDSCMEKRQSRYSLQDRRSDYLHLVTSEIPSMILPLQNELNDVQENKLRKRSLETDAFLEGQPKTKLCKRLHSSKKLSVADEERLQRKRSQLRLMKDNNQKHTKNMKELLGSFDKLTETLQSEDDEDTPTTSSSNHLSSKLQ